MKVDLISSAGLLEAAEIALLAERTGFSGLLFPESRRTPFLSVAAAGAATERIGLGTAVAVAFSRSPMVTAQLAWELAEATRGRFELGLGTQVRAHVERRFSAEYDHPGPRLEDYVRAVRAIFEAFRTGGRLDHEGDFYQHTLLPERWSPGPHPYRSPPILVAATGPWMLRMAGRVADGVHVHPLHSRAYLDQTVLPHVERGRAEVKRADPIRLIVPVLTIVGDTAEERAPWRRRARAQIAFYGSTREYARQFEQLGAPEVPERLRADQRAGRFESMLEHITDEMLDQFAVEADWDSLADRLIERYGGVADTLVLYMGEPLLRRDARNGARLAEVIRAVHAEPAAQRD